MVIFGILGGIGTGKTMAMIYLLKKDSDKNKKIMSNINIKNINNFELIKPEILEKLGYDFSNISLGIDEIHNFMDSRDNQKSKVKKKTHFILQSRHAGQGSLDIYYTTQHLSQVDIRLRNNTDVFVYPYIVARNNKNIPKFMAIKYVFKNGHKMMAVDELVYILPYASMYDTHEIVMYDED